MEEGIHRRSAVGSWRNSIYTALGSRAWGVHASLSPRQLARVPQTSTLRLGIRFPVKAIRNPFNLRTLIYHLTNRRRVRYSLVKVLLTVSPFGPSFGAQPDSFPHSPRDLSPLSTAFLPRAKPRGTPTRAVSPLSTAFTPNRTLSPLSTAFTQNDRGVGYVNHILSVNAPGMIDSQIICFHILTSCFFCNSFVFRTIRIARGCHPQRCMVQSERMESAWFVAVNGRVLDRVLSIGAE